MVMVSRCCCKTENGNELQEGEDKGCHLDFSSRKKNRGITLLFDNSFFCNSLGFVVEGAVVTTKADRSQAKGELREENCKRVFATSSSFSSSSLSILVFKFNYLDVSERKLSFQNVY